MFPFSDSSKNYSYINILGLNEISWWDSGGTPVPLATLRVMCFCTLESRTVAETNPVSASL